MKAIITKFIPCTNTKGSRIKASTGKGGHSVMIPYPHELNSEDAHEEAAASLCDKMNWSGGLISGTFETGEMVFVFTPAQIEQALRRALDLLSGTVVSTSEAKAAREEIMDAIVRARGYK